MKACAGIFRHVWAGALFLVFFSCKKSMIEDQADLTLKSNKQASAGTLTSPTVYVAGTQDNQAVYWKDDGTGIVTTVLPGGTQATGIQVVGGDVYVSGISYDLSTGDAVGMYWHNGNAFTLPRSNLTGDVWTSGITVSATGDVYITGYIGRYVETAVYWLNGVLNILPGGELTGQAVVASNGDVYVPNPDYRSYWKNGNLNTLNTLPGYAYYNALGLAVDGTDVYVVGSTLLGADTGKVAMYWKNNAPIALTPNTAYYEARDVAVYNGIAYVSGSGGRNSKEERVGIWINGIPGFTRWGTKPFSGSARIDINAGDIYVCGGEWEDASHSKAKYWMNGNVTNLTDGSVQAYAMDIDVVQ
ncbi:hypothetical protein [Chitinophaga filiformis]|uniref:Beta-propeller repeat-containing protein n=1 Tax=Chitinophaga filiformis TaxID=104663 RepID=A0A1G7H053_CHIFI|nr:hypothetical protein [Chitinophaga filiformis]SDE93796.1 hypothetical protein SAMN04488121_101243 [Chitinophaga filiformis]